MALAKSIVLGAAILTGAAVAATEAMAQYPLYAQSYPYYQAPVPVPMPPPAWNYDPYTTGMTACTNWWPGDPPCRETTHPSYGQPQFMPPR